MMKRMVPAGLALIAVVAVPSISRAGFEAVAGQNCVPGFSGQTTAMFYDWGGVANQSSSDLTVFCPVDTDARPTTAKIYVHAGAPQGFHVMACQVVGYASNQTGYWGAAKAPCGTTGGCGFPNGGPFQAGVDATLTWSSPLPTMSNIVSIGYACGVPLASNVNDTSTFSWIYGTKTNW